MDSEIKPVYQWKCGNVWITSDEESFADHHNFEFNDTRILYPAAALEAQTKQSNTLALVINDLTKMVTHDAETKAQFIERVKSILSVDPDLRVSELQSTIERLNGLYHHQMSNAQLDYHALQAINAAQAKRIAELEAIKPKRHTLTAKELSDPEYMESYLEAMHDDFDECVKYQCELKSQVKHWKANHEDLKNRLRVATHRTDIRDMEVVKERLKLYDYLTARVAELEQQCQESFVVSADKNLVIFGSKESIFAMNGLALEAMDLRKQVENIKELCAKEAEHWKKIGKNPEHKCGEYIAAAIRDIDLSAQKGTE